jgi:hypothetical protein
MQWEVKFQEIIVEADTEEEAREEAIQAVLDGNIEEESIEPL